MIDRFSESVVEDAALSWFEGLGYGLLQGLISLRGLVAIPTALLPKLLSGEIRVAPEFWEKAP